jgi:hypothetical protein
MQLQRQLLLQNSRDGHKSCDLVVYYKHFVNTDRHVKEKSDIQTHIHMYNIILHSWRT